MNKDILQRAPEDVDQDVSLRRLKTQFRKLILSHLTHSTAAEVAQELSKYPPSEYDLQLASERVRFSNDIKQDMKTLKRLKKLRSVLEKL